MELFQREIPLDESQLAKLLQDALSYQERLKNPYGLEIRDKAAQEWAAYDSHLSVEKQWEMLEKKLKEWSEKEEVLVSSVFETEKKPFSEPLSSPEDTLKHTPSFDYACFEVQMPVMVKPGEIYSLQIKPTSPYISLPQETSIEFLLEQGEIFSPSRQYFSHGSISLSSLIWYFRIPSYTREAKGTIVFYGLGNKEYGLPLSFELYPQPWERTFHFLGLFFFLVPPCAAYYGFPFTLPFSLPLALVFFLFALGIRLKLRQGKQNMLFAIDNSAPSHKTAHYSSQDTWNMLYHLAQEEEHQGNLEKALHYYETLLPHLPENLRKSPLPGGEILLSLGSLYFKVGQFSKAKQYCLEALHLWEKSRNSQSSKALALLARIYQELKDYFQAEEYYRQALSLQKDQHLWEDYVKTLKASASLYEAREDWEEARRIWDTLLPYVQEDPSSFAECLQKRGKALFAQKKYTEALENLEKAYVYLDKLPREEDKKNLLMDLGEIYRTQKNWEKAKNCFQGALKVSQRLPGAPGSKEIAQKLADIENQKESQ